MVAHVTAIGIDGVDPNRADRETRRKNAATSARQRQADDRAAKLTMIQDQVAAGDLVIRAMSNAERANWTRRHSATAARSTPTELAARAAALEHRRRQAERREG
jgi:hypothetical protein